MAVISLKFSMSVVMTKRGGCPVINEFHLTLVPLPMTQMIPDEKDLLGIRADPNTCEEAIPLIAHGSVKIEPMIPYIFPPRRVWKATEVLRVKAGIGSKGYR